MLAKTLAAPAALLLLLFVAPAASGTTPAELVCGADPSQSVVLTHDLTCTGSFVLTGGTPEAPVRIDLGGHTLTITTPDAPCVVNQPPFTQPMCAITARGSVEIVDGAVEGSIGLASTSAPGLVHEVTVDGDVWISGAGGRVARNRVDGSVHALGAVDTIQGNLITQGGVAFDDTSNAMTLTIRRNRILDSSGAGISGLLGGGGEFENDVVGDISNNAITSSQQAGIDLAGALTNFGPFTIAGNLLRHNGADGIRIGGIDDPPTPFVGGPMTLTSNRTLHNMAHGIDAGWVSNVDGSAIVDGGANTAVGNGQTPQCIGVVCS